MFDDGDMVVSTLLIYRRFCDELLRLRLDFVRQRSLFYYFICFNVGFEFTTELLAKTGNRSRRLATVSTLNGLGAVDLFILLWELMT